MRAMNAMASSVSTARCTLSTGSSPPQRRSSFLHGELPSSCRASSSSQCGAGSTRRLGAWGPNDDYDEEFPEATQPWWGPTPLPQRETPKSLPKRPPTVGDAALPAKPKHGIQRMTKGNGMEMVLHATCNEGEGLPAWGDRPEGVESPLSASKRRTKRLQFTCNKCQQRTTRAVNPHALKSGTVFVQCSHCLVHHKIVDHLNLFEDAQGPQFDDNVTTMYKPRRSNPFDTDEAVDWEGLSRTSSVGFNVWDHLGALKQLDRPPLRDDDEPLRDDNDSNWF